MASSTKRLNGPRCKALTKAGKPCEALAGSDGLCTAHRDPDRMRELGRAGGKARRGGLANQLPPESREGLREELRKLDPAIVRTAIEQALAGGNESARVSAVKLLADIDAFNRDGGCRVCAQVKAEAPLVREKLNRLIEGRAAAAAEASRDEELKTLEPVIQYVAQQYAASGGVVPFDVSAEQAEAIFQHLGEVGLLVPGHKVEERAEQIAQERLQALKAEHGLAGVTLSPDPRLNAPQR